MQVNASNAVHRLAAQPRCVEVVDIARLDIEQVEHVHRQIERAASCRRLLHWFLLMGAQFSRTPPHEGHRPGDRLKVSRLCLACLLLAVTVEAHDVIDPPSVEITFRPQGSRLVVDAHLPAAALAQANLPPTTGGETDRDAGAPLELIARVFASALEVTQDGAPLPVSSADASKADDKNGAVVRLAYDLRGGALSARLPTYRAGAIRLITNAHVDPAGGVFRSFSVSGESVRVDLNPSRLAAARHMASAAVTRLRASSDLLLFVICLGVPLATRPWWLAALVCLLFGESAAVLVSGSTGLDGVLPFLPAGRAVAASAIVIAALLAVADGRGRWVQPVAFIFGAAHGLGIRHDFQSERFLAGSYPSFGLAVFLVAMLLAQVWLAAVVRAGFTRIVHWGVPSRMLTIAIGVVSGHFALHRMTAIGRDLEALESETGGRWLGSITLAWLLGMLCAGVLETTWLSRLRRVARQAAPGGKATE